MTESIRRVTVEGVLGRLILGELVGMGLAADEAQKKPEKREQRGLAGDYAKQRIFAFMRVAIELGIYEETVSEIAIPEDMIKEFWGEDYKKPQRRG